MVDLGRSVPKTLSLLDEGKADEALAEYRTGCLAAVKKLYSEAAKVYPPRFSKAEAWCVWTKALYVQSRQVDKALAAKDPNQVRTLMARMRTHFYELHLETETLNANDWIYAFRQEVLKDAPSMEELNRIVTQFGRAQASLLTREKDEQEPYARARDLWLKAVEPRLKAETLAVPDLETLRKATETFYRVYGVQFE